MALKHELRELFRLHTGDRPGLITLTILLISGITIYLVSKPTSASSFPPEAPLLTSADTLQKDSIYTDTHPLKPKEKPSLERNAEYVGPPAGSEYTPKRRIPQGATIDLNQADSALLTRVPGIGPAFARRIVSYRERLGGYYTVLQLQEVWGMTSERYQQIKPFFTVNQPPVRINLSQTAYDSIPFHPYLNRAQRNTIERLLFRDGKLHGWSQLAHLDAFTKDDSVRLSHYFLFE